MRLTSPGGDGAIVAGGNTAAVLAALTDGADETENPLFVAAGLQGFNGATLDMVRTEGTDRDAIAAETLGNLQAIIFPHIFNGASWDRQRALGAASLNGLGQASVATAIPGASAVKSITDTVTTSTTRVTLVTPGSGKRIRVISVYINTQEAGGTLLDCYFGTGTNAQTTPANIVLTGSIPSTAASQISQTWPDGAGPVGAADEVLSWRNGNGGGNTKNITVHFREE